MVFHQRHWIRAVIAELIGIGTIVLGRLIVDDPQMVESMARGLATPMTWPRLMLSGAGLCAIGWAIEEGWKAFHFVQAPSAAEEAMEFGDVGFEEESAAPPLLPIALGLGLALAYAFVIPWLGFTLATVIFLLLWFLIGGIRRPVKLLSVTLIGTGVLLFVFVKVALMPLDRGTGVFGEFTIALFRLLGIY
ncbi:MAG: tripartite tricarboxylate transporter TctB family protein [Rhodocyclaceae bacterium]|jgi:putative tricarboxylic transport membrane protein|nr:tripartite tricarboxylate transporter TctB family protein [Rhodocyclaceae bacterium]MBK6553973.1 tripartite tricarboxylate transporter TctB family protein [Rhodocyclaceae bacterium]MBK6678069.1 tripartite tricarboxylate transporter TctB family protein [Rhodocyclaceae bacterium]MBK9310748.1 tripartite tricarboxylate transporter TctB family protein [Rhodocyclaceae bacterium]MBK9954183.1 tripartite tricarboxylate transporter TctB family protein [Rhodocyclaceae bacterium]